MNKRCQILFLAIKNGDKRLIYYFDPLCGVSLTLCTGYDHLERFVRRPYSKISFPLDPKLRHRLRTSATGGTSIASRIIMSMSGERGFYVDKIPPCLNTRHV